MINSLVFDFDGLILDTEITAFQSWQEIYQEYQCDLPLDKWVLCIGTDTNAFEPHTYLESLIGQTIPRNDLARKRLERHLELIEEQMTLPGVEQYLVDARRLGLKIGVASSSSRSWVMDHLTRLGLMQYFEAMKFGDEVTNVKPDPELYLSVLEQLGAQPEQAVALEDSPNGARAAKNAGMFCVAIPNQLTCQLDLDHADMRLSSMADMPLERLIAEIEAMKKGNGSRIF